jgi:PIF1-like helicase/Helix-turn-helix domain/HRDC domain/UvrD-like helicase C-terminal domain
MEIIRNESFDLAYRFVTETRQNIFLTGKAGTGKTTFLKYLRETTGKNIAVTAPTGVAAINAGGVTLHSFFQLPFGPYIPDASAGGNVVNAHSLLARTRYQREKINVLRSLELLVIDEASMVPCYTVDAIDTILRSVRRQFDRPFGGVQVLFIGDLHQLQPVVKNEEWEILKAYYPGVFFFQSHVLQIHPPVVVELKEIYRQKDETFISLLNEIRTNNLTEQSLKLLNSRLRRGFEPAQEEGYITLTTHNASAEKINKKFLDALDSRSRVFKADMDGEFPTQLFPAEAELELKKGAQVMFLKNDGEAKRYFNGKIGTVKSFDGKEVFVRCPGETNDIVVTQNEWENVSYSLDEETKSLNEKVMGTFRQFPLRLAWAITIHKSQGLTFDKVIIDAENAFANGQVYVALSRCRTFEGLVLSSPVSGRFLGAHSQLKTWHEENDNEGQLPVKLNQERREFVVTELSNVFNFDLLRISTYQLKNELQNQFMYLNPGWEDWIALLVDKASMLESTAAKFRNLIKDKSAAGVEIETDEYLQGRIKDGANYFLNEWAKWKHLYKELPVTSKTKGASAAIAEPMEEINEQLHEIVHRLTFCKNGFNLSEYLTKGRRVTGTPENVRNIYAAEHAAKLAEVAPSLHPELYKKISAFRSKLAEERNQPKFTIFSNKAIMGVCERLPGNLVSLRAVPGFGKSNVATFGEEVIQLVLAYCAQKALIPTIEEEKPKATQKHVLKASVSILETVSLFREKLDIVKVANSRGLVPGTIESHLAKAISLDLVSLEEVMSAKEYELIISKIPTENEIFSIQVMKENLPEEISYGKIRMALAWKKKKESLEKTE